MFYDAMENCKGGISNPYYDFFVNETPEIIDFPASAFRREGQLISVSSLEEFNFKRMNVEAGYIESSALAFKEKWDIMRIFRFTSSGILIPEAVKQEFTVAKLSGVEYNSLKPTRIEFLV